MKFILYANTDWYLYNFRLSTALRLKRAGHEVIMLSPPGEFGGRFESHGLRWLTLPMNRASLNPFTEMATLRALVRVLRRERPDLLHNFTVKCAIYGAIAARCARIRCTVHAVAGMGFVFTGANLKARLLKPIVTLLMRRTLGRGASLVVLQNPDDVDAFVESSLVPANKLRLIRSSGVDLNRFQPGPGSENGILRVLLVARLLWEKGIQEFVDASSLLHRQGRQVQFLLAGTPDAGNPRSVTHSQAQKWSDDGLVTWLGHIEDMPGLLATVDVLALPSYYREGVPKSLIEGAAAGLALITTAQPGCREVVSMHGEDGLVVAPRDADGLAELIAQLDDDRLLLRRLGNAARRKAVAMFDEQLVIEKTIDVYDELLAPERVTRELSA